MNNINCNQNMKLTNIEIIIMIVIYVMKIMKIIKMLMMKMLDYMLIKMKQMLI